MKGCAFLLASGLMFSAHAQAPPPVFLDHIWGKIRSVTTAGFEVDQNFNADPQSAYRRQVRRIELSPGTKFEESAREDLRVGRTVDILGQKTTGLNVRASRVIVYEGNAPVRMRPDARVTLPNGQVRTR